MNIEGSTQELLEDCLIEWQPAATAPYGVDLDLAVIDGGAIHTLVFPCRRVVYGWVNARSGAAVEIRPTHWRR